MASKTYQIYLKLLNSEPVIWRRLLVSDSVTLNDLHKIIQTAMGWTNSHLHQFVKDRQFYEPPAPIDIMGDSSGIDCTGLTLDQFLARKNDVLEYEYDLGDGWAHEIKLEKIIEDDRIDTPVCIDEARACPPEDCGGIWGYQKLKEVIGNPDHEEYEFYKDRAGDEFDLEDFEKDRINTWLKRDNYGVIEL